ncbi:transporter substrate-binding domain-containing protein [Streptomyces chrestomyceticus]|uniref:transporter substrate-binding domain-containing protein n=1 Tax=Streptomyces chrestomyceticus TaxID=68185 RepID=UPI0033FF9E7D
MTEELPVNTWRPNGRRGVAALGAMALLAATASCGESKPMFAGRDRITIAYKGDQPGTSFRDNTTAFTGFDVKVGNHILKQLNIASGAPVDIAAGDRVGFLKRNGVDLVIATFSVTPDRMKEVDFAGIYAKTFQGLLVKKGVSVHPGMEVCTLAGTNSEKALKDTEDRNVKEVEVKPKSTLQECVDLLEEGGVKGISTDQMILYGLMHHLGGEKYEVLPDVEIGVAQYYGIGMRKGYREDCERLKGIVQEYVKSTDWQKDFAAELPDIAELGPNFWPKNFRPTEGESENRSCRDGESS